MSPRVGLLPLLSLLLASACAAGAEDPAATPPTPPDPATQYATLGDFCKARASAECNELVATKCATAGVAACVTTRTAACLSDAPQGVKLISKNADACISAVASIYDDGKVSITERDALAQACGANVFSGPGAARAPCTSDFDCATVDGLACVVTMGATDGKCLKPNLVAPAAPCPGEADVCPTSYYCEAKSKTCAAKALESQDCQPGVLPCDDGLWCPGNPFAGGCKPLAQSGESCKLDSDCVPSAGLCDKLAGSPDGNCTDSITLTALDTLCTGFQAIGK